MRKNSRVLIATLFIVGSVFVGLLLFLLEIWIWTNLISNIWFWLFVISWVLLITEVVNWVRNGKRSDMADLVVIAFLFFSVYLIKENFFLSLIGAFSIYLIFGLLELKEYTVLNRLALITVITYNVIFFAGLVSDKALNTAFALSFWLILILGFVFFGRKYIVVWRFMSPQYLTLGLFLIAWLGVETITEFTPFNLTPYIYAVLIVTEIFIYFISGSVLGRVLGAKPTENPMLTQMVAEISAELGIKRKVKVNFASYPIINAMAYGPFFDPRICIIAESLEVINREELKGIVAHELAHVRGRHTTTLAFISIADLAFRWAVGIPATYYDYIFTNPNIPMFGFILLNIGIFVILYIFVRVLEARADRKVKEIGLGENLARALFTLEGFYAHGREIGLNTMLLCDEKLLPENQMLDYYETGRYLSNYLVRPSRLSVLANFMNSHPPSAIRIASMYTDIEPSKEALYTFTLLGSKKNRRFGKKMREILPEVNKDITDVFRSKFNIPDIAEWNRSLNKTELYNTILGRSFLFIPKVEGELVSGKVVAVNFINNFLDAVEYTIETNSGNVDINPLYYKSVEIYEGGLYYLREREEPLRLVEINGALDEEKAQYVFQNVNTSSGEEEKIHLPVKKTRLPLSLAFLDGIVGQDVFQKDEGTLKLWKLSKFEPLPEERDFQVTFQNEKEGELTFRGQELLIFPRSVFLNIFADEQTSQWEERVIQWLIDHEIRVSVYLKKPINNAESGKIVSQFIADDGKSKKNTLTIRNIFGKEKTVTWRELEGIFFEENTFRFQVKKRESFTSLWWYKLLKRFSPQKVFM